MPATGPKHRERLLAILILLFVGLIPPRAGAQTAPTDPSGFTAYIATQFRKALTGDQVKITAQLRLAISAHGGETAYLDTIYSACLRDAGACGMLVQTYVAQMSAMYRSPEPPLDRQTLRVTVRPTNYVDQLRAGLAAHGGAVVWPLAGNLWVVLVADEPTVIRMVNGNDLARLGISSDQGLALAKQNMIAEMLAPLEKIMHGDQQSVMLLTGDPYESSLMAFPELWAPLAEKFHGNLVVAAPAADVVLCGEASDSSMPAEMTQAAQTVVENAERPFDATLFRWSPKGWSPL